MRRFHSALAAGLLAGVIDALLVHRPVGLRLGEVSILDLYDQLLRYLPESRQPLHSRPRPVIASYKMIDSPRPAKFTAAFSAVQGRYHLIQWRDGSEELYDLDTDLEETKPLPIRADDRALAELGAELRRNTKEESAGVISLRGVRYLQ